MIGNAPTNSTTRSSGILLLLGGPAGAGKSTIAQAWCAAQARAAHIELDEVRHLIVAGRADPQQPGSLQSESGAAGERRTGRRAAIAREGTVRGIVGVDLRQQDERVTR